jgi:hypothetical protein
LWIKYRQLNLILQTATPVTNIDWDYVASYAGERALHNVLYAFTHSLNFSSAVAYNHGKVRCIYIRPDNVISRTVHGSVQPNNRTEPSWTITIVRKNRNEPLWFIAKPNWTWGLVNRFLIIKQTELLSTFNWTVFYD